jgi:hypothetical protein
MRRCGFAVLVLALPAALAGQRWNAPDARALADRAILRRGARPPTPRCTTIGRRRMALCSSSARSGGLAEPPRLIKADQLELEVY